MGTTGEMSGKAPGPEDSPGMEISAEDLLALTEGAELTVELEPATGSRLKGSNWIATIPSLGVTASALGLEATLELVALEAVGAADEVVRGNEPGRDERLAIALRVLALEKLGRLREALASSEVVAESFLEMVRPPDAAA